jgi:hypothetical protein
MKRYMRLWLESLEWGKFGLTFGGNGLSKFADWLLVKLVCVFQELGNLAWARWLRNHGNDNEGGAVHEVVCSSMQCNVKKIVTRASIPFLA